MSPSKASCCGCSNADPLTTLANRRAFDEAMATEWLQAVTRGTPLALLLIDVDCFKPFNDNYGHLVGDRCLRLVADVLTTGARRAGETIARYGGDEFAILIPGTDAGRAAALARHLCQRVAELGLPHAHSTVAAHVTISVGVASIRLNSNVVRRHLTRPCLWRRRIGRSTPPR